MFIQSPGDRMKSFRKKYHIRQHELCGDIITRNMLSMIENNKTPLAASTAEKLIVHIKDLCLSKGIPCTLTLTDLLNTPETQIIELTKHIVENIDNGILENPLENPKINELFLLQERYNLSYENALLHYSVGSYFLEHQDFQRAYAHYLKTLANTTILQKHAFSYVYRTYEKALYCCIQLNLYEEVINLYNLISLDLKEFPDLSVYSITFNVILAYRKLNQYNEALKNIFDLEYTCNRFLNENPDKKLNLLISKCNAYKDIKLYTEAINIYKEILSFSDHSLESYLLILLNLSEIFRLQNAKLEVSSYTDQFKHAFLKYTQSDTKHYSVTFNLGLADNMYFLEDYPNSEYYYLQALDLILKGHQPHLIIDVINGLYELIVHTEDYRLLDHIVTAFRNKSLSLSLVKANIPFKLIQVYLKIDDLKSIHTLNELIISNL